MRPVLLYRASSIEPEELEAAQEAGWPCTPTRMAIKPGDLVVPRYSALPFYAEQDHDITIAGARLVNSLREHRYVADLLEYVADLGDMTPTTWSQPSEVPQDEPGAFVLKGATNSRKFEWKTSMFAKDRAAVMEVFDRLLDDTMIGQQPIYVRRYVPLRRFMTAFWDLPITREFRFFVYRGKVLSGGYYWASHWEDLQGKVDPALLDPAGVPRDWLQVAIDRVQGRVPFFAIDVAEKEAGGWMVVELNDGSMSGLSMNDPRLLYENLLAALKIPA